MEYPPHAHVGHHRHHNNRDDDDSDFPPPPPPPFSHSKFPPQQDSYGGGYNQPPPQQDSYGGGYNQPPPRHQNYPPPPQHDSYGGPYNQPPPHQESYGGAYNQPPPPPQHESYGGTTTAHHHGFQPHMPSFGSHSHTHESQYGSGTGPDGHSYGGGPGPDMGLGHLENKPSHKIHCKAGGDRFVFGIRDGKVVLTRPDPSDLTQEWYKDEQYSIKVKDKDGHPSFMLVNKGTRQAVKHSVSCHPVQLAPYKADVLDESVLWTESKDLGSGYRSIRTVNNVRLVMDAWNADKDHGGIHDGTLIALYETWKGDNQNQQWKFERHCNASFSLPIFKLLETSNLCLVYTC